MQKFFRFAVIPIALAGIVFICCHYYRKNTAGAAIKVSVSDHMFILTTMEEITLYETITENTMTCDLAAFSNIYNGMVKDGYVVMEATTSESAIDVTLCKDEQYYRIVYKSSGNFYSFGSPYEKSYIPLTYISKGSTGQIQ